MEDEAVAVHPQAAANPPLTDTASLWCSYPYQEPLVLDLKPVPNHQEITLNPAPPRKMKIILKLKKEIEEIVVPAPALGSSSSENNSMKLKLQVTKRKLEQSYGEEAEKKAKKKIQRIDDYSNLKNHSHSSSSKVKAQALDHGDVRERVLTKMKTLKKKNQNLKPNYTLYSNKTYI